MIDNTDPNQPNEADDADRGADFSLPAPTDSAAHSLTDGGALGDMTEDDPGDPLDDDDIDGPSIDDGFDDLDSDDNDSSDDTDPHDADLAVDGSDDFDIDLDDLDSDVADSDDALNSADEDAKDSDADGLGNDSEPDDLEIQLGSLDDSSPLDTSVTDLLAIHQINVDDFNDTLQRLGLDVEPDGRAFAIALEQHDVVASVEHTDFDRIASLLSNGAEIHLGNGETLIDLDDQTDEAVVQQGDVERRIPLSELDDRWSASTYELLVSHHDEHIVVVMGLDPAEDGGVSG